MGIINLITEEFWRRGELAYLLRPYQVGIYNQIKNAEGDTWALNCSRRFGKTTVSLIVALELGLTNKDFYIRFVTGEVNDAQDIVDTLFIDLLKDCPEDIKPEWRATKGYYYFPKTGARLYITGVNNKRANKARGRRMNLGIVDEASYVEDLNYVITSILRPQTLGIEGSQIILTYTPPDSPDHDCKKYNDRCKRSGHYFEQPVWDMLTEGHITKAELDKIADEADGYESTTFQREYECKWVVETKRVIIPEWSTVMTTKPVVTRGNLLTQDVKHSPEYQYFDKYVGMDMGTRHYTVLIFGYYHFKDAVFVVEDEWYERGNMLTTTMIAEACGEKENALWGHNKPYLRVADNSNLQLLNDLNIEHQQGWMATSKSVVGDNRQGMLESMVNHLRQEVKQGKIIIEPRCEFLIGSLEAGIWNKNRTEWQESETYGHYDAIASLMYLMRNVDKHHNPVPQFWTHTQSDSFIKTQKQEKAPSPGQNLAKDLFGMG